MAYKKVYPSEFDFDLTGTTLEVGYSKTPQHSPDLWSIKYLFDKGLGNIPTKVCIEGSISPTMALRMYYLDCFFPNITFCDTKHDKYRADAEEIIHNVGTKYVTYESKAHPLERRGTKEKPESTIEKELADNLSKYIPDFPVGVKAVRQFPANVFTEPISKDSRITDKLWIDMVSVNSANELSPIELKVGGNIPLDLFAQGLDYGIYCHLFNEHIKKQWFADCSKSRKDKVTIYYVGEAFHPALTGRGDEKGIVSLIRRNDLFNVVFVKITVDKVNRKISNPETEIIFDTRNL